MWNSSLGWKNTLKSQFPTVTADIETTALRFAAVNSAVVAMAICRALLRAMVPAVQIASAVVWA